VRDTGDWEQWLRFFLQGVVEVAREATETARLIVALRERHRALVVEQFGRGAGGALKVLEAMYSRPVVSVNDVAKLTETTYAAASALVRRLVSNGLLVESTGQARHRRFRYEPYIRLFSDAPSNRQVEESS
jgi:Fic family protein